MPERPQQQVQELGGPQESGNQQQQKQREAAMTETDTPCRGAAEPAKQACTASPFVLPECCLPHYDSSPAQSEASGTARAVQTSSRSEVLQGEREVARVLLRCFHEARFWSIDRKPPSVRRQGQPPQQRQEQEELQQREEQEELQEGEEHEELQPEEEQEELHQEEEKEELQQEEETEELEQGEEQEELQQQEEQEELQQQEEQEELQQQEEQEELQQREEQEELQQREGQEEVQQREEQEELQQREEQEEVQQREEQEELQQREDRQPQGQEEQVEMLCATKAELQTEQQEQVLLMHEEKEELLPPLFRLFLKYSCNLTLVGERVLSTHLQLLPLVICASPAQSDMDNSRPDNGVDSSSDSSKDTHANDSTTSSLCSRSSDAHSRDSSSSANCGRGFTEEDETQQLEDESAELEADPTEKAWASLLRMAFADDVTAPPPATKRRIGSDVGAAVVDTLPGAEAAVDVRSNDAGAVEPGGLAAYGERNDEVAAAKTPPGEPAAAVGRHEAKNTALKDYYLRHIRLQVPGPLQYTKTRYYRSEDDITAVPPAAGALQMTAAGAPQSGAATPAGTASTASCSASSQDELLTRDKDEEETFGPAFSYGMLLLRLSALRPQVRALVLKAAVPFGRVLEEEGVERRVWVEEKLHIHISRDLFTVGLPTEPALHAEGEGQLHRGTLGAATGEGEPAAGDATPTAGSGETRAPRVIEDEENDCGTPAQEERQPGCTCQFLSVEEGRPDKRPRESAATGTGETAGAADREPATDLSAEHGGPTATTAVSATPATLSEQQPQGTTTPSGTTFFTETRKRRHCLAEEGWEEVAAAAGGGEGKSKLCTFGRWSVMSCDGRPAARVLEILNAPLIVAAAAAAVAEGRRQQQHGGGPAAAEDGCGNSIFAENDRTASDEAATGSTQATAASAGDETAAAGRNVVAAAAAGETEERSEGITAKEGDEGEIDEAQVLKDLQHLQRVCLCTASSCPVHKHWLEIPRLWGPPAVVSHGSTAADAARGAAGDSCSTAAENGNVDRATSEKNAGMETGATVPEAATVEAAGTRQNGRTGVAVEKTNGPSTTAAAATEEVLAGGVCDPAVQMHGSRSAAAESDGAAATAADSAAGAAAAATSAIAEDSAEEAAASADSSMEAETANYKDPCFNCGSAVCVTEFSRDAQGRILV